MTAQLMLTRQIGGCYKSLTEIKDFRVRYLYYV